MSGLVTGNVTAVASTISHFQTRVSHFICVYVCVCVFVCFSFALLCLPQKQPGFLLRWTCGKDMDGSGGDVMLD